MPIVLAVNGIVESYPVQPTGRRAARVPAVDAQGDQPGADRAAQAARSAYQQQSRPGATPKPALLARDLMTSPVITLSSDATLADAWSLMQRHGIRHIPVLSLHGALVGIVADRDLLRHTPELILKAEAGPAAHQRLGAVMTHRVISATPTTDLRDVARVMFEERIHAVPILDTNRRPVGILTTRDLLRGIATHGPLELWT